MSWAGTTPEASTPPVWLHGENYGVGYIHQRHGTERDGTEMTKVGNKVVTYLEV